MNPLAPVALALTLATSCSTVPAPSASSASQARSVASPGTTVPGKGQTEDPITGDSGASKRLSGQAVRAQTLTAPAVGAYEFEVSDQELGDWLKGYRVMEVRSSPGRVGYEVAVDEIVSAQQVRGHRKYLIDDDALWQTSSSFVIGSSQARECDFSPMLPKVRFPLKVGEAWSYAGSCQGETFTVTTRVDSKDVIKVGDRLIEVFLLRESGSRGLTRVWFAPSIGLPLRIAMDSRIERLVSAYPK